MSNKKAAKCIANGLNLAAMNKFSQKEPLRVDSYSYQENAKLWCDTKEHAIQMLTVRLSNGMPYDFFIMENGETGLRRNKEYYLKGEDNKPFEVDQFDKESEVVERFACKFFNLPDMYQ